MALRPDSVEVAATMPILLAQELLSVANVRAARELTCARRLRYEVLIGPADDPAAIVDRLSLGNRQMRSEHVAINTCKVWADGTVVSGGALMLAQCCGNVDGRPGAMTFDPDHIEAQIDAAQAAGFDIHVHMNADGSARVVLDAYEAVRRRRGTEGRRWRRHPRNRHSGDSAADPDRGAAGPGPSGHRRNTPPVPRQRMGLQDALRGYTANGAFQLRLEHRTGTLNAGVAADLTVLGSDLFRADPNKIPSVPVEFTMMDGRVTQ